MRSSNGIRTRLTHGKTVPHSLHGKQPLGPGMRHHVSTQITGARLISTSLFPEKMRLGCTASFWKPLLYFWPEEERVRKLYPICDLTGWETIPTIHIYNTDRNWVLLPSTFYHPHFIIPILSSAFFTLHFSIWIFPQQREMTKFCVVGGTRMTTSNFSSFYLEMNAVIAYSRRRRRCFKLPIGERALRGIVYC